MKKSTIFLKKRCGGIDRNKTFGWEGRREVCFFSRQGQTWPRVTSPSEFSFVPAQLRMKFYFRDNFKPPEIFEGFEFNRGGDFLIAKGLSPFSWPFIPLIFFFFVFCSYYSTVVPHVKSDNYANRSFYRKICERRIPDFVDTSFDTLFNTHLRLTPTNPNLA